MFSFPIGKEAVLPRQLYTFLLGKAAILLWQLLSFFLGKEAIYPKQAFRQVLSFPIGKEAVLPMQLLTFLLEKAAILLQQLLSFLPGKEAVLPRQPLILPWEKELAISRQVNQAIKQGQVGRALGILLGIGHSRLPRRIVLPPRQTALSPRKTTPPLPFPVGFPKHLLMKNLNLSGSLTFPTSL